MKEPYVEGIANHNGHESCADNPEVIREALDSGMYGLGIEPRKQLIRVPTRSWHAEGNTKDINNARCQGLCVVGDPIHVQKLYARESGDPTIGLEHFMNKVRIENPIGVQQ
jgi:hypothetical protein